MYVSASINGQALCALLDIRAMHNFILEDEAKHLCLKDDEGKRYHEGGKLVGQAHYGHCTRCARNAQNMKRKTQFLYRAPFKMVLGMKFFDQVHVFLLSATNSLSIIDGSMVCTVLAKSSKIAHKMLSDMQFTKAF